MASKEELQNEYNAWFRRMIGQYCPNLFTSITIHEHDGIFYHEASIEDPRGPKYLIRISSYGRELTLFCNSFHAHFDQFSEDDREKEFLALLEWIEEFRNDRILIFRKLKGEQIGSVIAAEPTYEISAEPGERIEIISFTGKLDRVIQ